MRHCIIVSLVNRALGASFENNAIRTTAARGRIIMDSTIIAGGAAVLGSVVGATATIIATWITQRAQTVRSKNEAKLRDREALYGEFITEASRLTFEALTNKLEQPETFVKLFGIVGRIRLIADSAVLVSAEACCRQIVELYASPTMTVDQIRSAFEHGQIDPLKDFSTACRTELLAIAQEY